MQFRISDTTLKYMTDGIRHVCEKFKNRAPGTESERNSQVFFKDELGKYSDKVIMEDFDLHPHTFLGFIPVAAVLTFISMFLYWLAPKGIVFPIIGSVLTVFSVSMFIFEFLFYREYVDFLFPKRVSRNVYAAKAPTGEVKRRIIFGGHADASYEWTYSLHGQIKTLGPVIFGAIGGMFFVAVTSVAITIKSVIGGAASIDGVWRVLGIINMCFIPFVFAIIKFLNYKVVVDGANDNLSACYASMAVLKEMTDADFRFENTEVGCLISGSEEAGLRGAKAFATKHEKEMKEIETVFISLDTMHEIEQLQVYTQGCTGTVRDSEAVGDLLHEAGVNVGYDMPRAELYPGAVDAEAFSIHGIRACGFCGVNHNPKTYYHTRLDSADNINPKCIRIAADVCLEAARLYDEAGGITKYENNRK